MQWSVPRELLWAIIAALVVIVFGFSHALLMRPPYAPVVESQHNGDTESSAKPIEKHTERGESEGTEFWPTVFGIRLKITDSLLAVFTFGLLIFTGMLWRSTDKLWTAGERQLMVLTDTVKRQLRAYVTVNGVIRTKDPGDLMGRVSRSLLTLKIAGKRLLASCSNGQELKFGYFLSRTTCRFIVWKIRQEAFCLQRVKT